MSKLLLAVVNPVESITTLFKHLTIVGFEGIEGLVIIACGTDDVARTFALRIRDDIDGEDIAIIESPWHRKS